MSGCRCGVCACETYETAAPVRVAALDARRYRLTRYSVLWIAAAVLLIPYEVAMIVLGHEGGPLTHVVKWAYGDPGSARWWLLGWATSGALLWLVPHFLWEGFALRALLVCTGTGLVLGAVGMLATR